jgi:hypothetical protein
MEKKQHRYCGAITMKHSDTDKSLACYRTSRMFRENGNWFFKTREGDTVGPFQEELEASTRLEVYIRLVNAGLLPFNEELRATSVAKSKKALAK